MLFYLIEQHPKFLLHTLQVLYMCRFCDSTNINTLIDMLQFGMNSIIVLMFVESQRVHI